MVIMERFSWYCATFYSVSCWKVHIRLGKECWDNCENICLITLFVELYNVEICVGVSKSCRHRAVTVKLANVRIKLQFRSPKFLGRSFHLHLKLGKQLHDYSLIC